MFALNHNQSHIWNWFYQPKHLFVNDSLSSLSDSSCFYLQTHSLLWSFSMKSNCNSLSIFHFDNHRFLASFQTVKSTAWFHCETELTFSRFNWIQCLTYELLKNEFSCTPSACPLAWLNILSKNFISISSLCTLFKNEHRPVSGAHSWIWPNKQFAISFSFSFPLFCSLFFFSILVWTDCAVLFLLFFGHFSSRIEKRS